MPSTGTRASHDAIMTSGRSLLSIRTGVSTRPVPF